MQGFVSALRRVFDRWIGWKRLGLLASVTIVAIAVMHLVKTLKGINSAHVLLALEDKSYSHIALAALCVFCAFCTLTFYDLFALRTIGKFNVPYRVAAFTSFTSYSIGHNIGATVFTGGAVRFRIYSAWGLNVIDVTKIAFVTGLTFWLGNAFVLGVGMAYEPAVATAIDQLAPWANRLLGLGML